MTPTEFTDKHSVKMTVHAIPSRTGIDMADFPEGSSHYLIILEYDSRAAWFGYSKGPGCTRSIPGTMEEKSETEPEPPHLLEILECCASDSTCSDDLDDFVADFGYDGKLVATLHTFEACKAQTKLLADLFGPEAIEDLQRIEW